MTTKYKSILTDVYRFWEFLERSDNSEAFWLKATQIMEQLFDKHDNDPLLARMLMTCYWHASNLSTEAP